MNIPEPILHNCFNDGGTLNIKITGSDQDEIENFVEFMRRVIDAVSPKIIVLGTKSNTETGSQTLRIKGIK